MIKVGVTQTGKAVRSDSATSADTFRQRICG